MEITSGAIPDSIPGNRKRPNTTVGELRALGIKLDAGLADDINAGVVSLDGKDGTLNWVVFDNFYVLMRYTQLYVEKGVPRILAECRVDRLQRFTQSRRRSGRTVSLSCVAQLRCRKPLGRGRL